VFKRETFLGILCLVLIVAMLAVGCSKPATENKEAQPAQKKIVAKLGHVLAPNTPFQMGAEKFAELVTKKTNGQVEIQIYPNSQLGADRDLIEGQKMGTIEFALPGTSIFSQYEASIAVFGLPFLFKDRAEVYKVLDGPVGQELYGVSEKQNIKVLALFESGFRQLGTTRKAVNSIADLKGLKIRVPQGDLYVKTWKALGVNPTPMAWNELFTALQTGVVDGEEAPLTIFASSGFGEVVKNFAYINYLYDPVMLTVSNKFWTQLTPELQKAIEEAAVEARDYQRKQVQELEKVTEDDLKAKQAVKFTNPDLTPFQDAMKSVYEGYADKETLNKILKALNR